MNKVNVVSEFVNPFSRNVRKLSEQLDNATIDKNFNELEQLLADAEKMLCDENTASQAQLYYLMGTVYSDFAKFKGISNEESTEKQLYYFRKSISLIEVNEYFDEKYKRYFTDTSIMPIVLSNDEQQIKNLQILDSLHQTVLTSLQFG